MENPKSTTAVSYSVLDSLRTTNELNNIAAILYSYKIQNTKYTSYNKSAPCCVVAQESVRNLSHLDWDMRYWIIITVYSSSSILAPTAAAVCFAAPMG